MRPAVVHVLVRHEAWCPMAYGEGHRCACTPSVEAVTPDEFAATLAHDLRNRAQRRADAKRARLAGSEQ